MSLTTERQKVAHLLRRFAFGASEAELDYYGKDGVAGAIKLLTNFAAQVESVAPEPERFAGDNGAVNIRVAQAWFYVRLFTTLRPLEAKLTLFWHDHFATSAQKVDRPPMMVKHVETLRTHCAAPFLQLLTEVSKDPAMLYWLDNAENKVGQPNENFAREVMELFTLEIGHYSEEDIQEAARAFTGWAYGASGARGRRVPVFVFNKKAHDPGTKTVLGKTGAFNGDDVLKILCENPQTARTIVTKMWSWFAYPEPERALVERLTQIYINSGLDTLKLVRAIMESKEFYSDRAERALVKNPVDFCFSTARQLGLNQITAARVNDDQITGPARVGPAGAVMQAGRAMGMELMYPPDVAGWPAGDGWISSATMVERMKWADRLFGKAQGRGGAPVQYDPWFLFEADPTPAGAVKRLLSVFDAELPAAKVVQLQQAASKASGGRVTATNASATANAVAKLIFGSPEFQFQ